MAVASTSIIDTYEYMDETKIDDEFKCTILNTNEHHSCPTCRRSLALNQDEKFSVINTHIVNKQLDRLLVRCNQCNEINIQRGNFPEHEEKCLKKLVQCPWKGLRDELDIHLEECPFQQVRLIIDHLRTQLDLSLRIQTEFQEILENKSDQINFLQAFISQGNPVNNECLKLYSRCQYSMRNQSKCQIKFHCTLYDNTMRRRYVSLHACLLNDYIDCIC